MSIKRVMICTCAVAVLSCGPERQGPLPDGGWVAEMMDTPEYAKACADTPGCEALREPLPAASESLWRVRVVRRPADDVRMEQVDVIQVPAGDGVPIGPLSGSHAVVGLNKAGDVLDGQVLRFPDSMRAEYADDSSAGSIDLTDREVDAIAYLRISSSIVSLAVRDLSGKTLHSIAAPTLEPAIARNGDSGPWGISSAWAASRPFQGLPPYCSHVVVLEGEPDRHLAANVMFGDEVTLARPGPYQLAATRAALDRMTPMLCQSIGRIAFGYVPESITATGAVNSFGAGDLMLISVTGKDFHEETLRKQISSQLRMQSTIIHEAGHSAETLLTVESSRPAGYGGMWGFPPRTQASKTIDRVRLEKGMPDEWQRLHQSFVTHGWAADYGDSSDWSTSQIAAGGFITKYGSKNWAEDIATFVEYAYMSQPTALAYSEHGVPDTLREDTGCLEAQRHMERNLPAHLAALYTKLHFLQDLGLVQREDLRACVGEQLGLPVDGAGFHVWEDAALRRSFRNQMTAGIGTRENGVPIFEMEATGEAGFADKTYPARVKLRLDLGTRFSEIREVSWPRGVYELGLFGDNNFLIRLDGAAAGNFDAMDGFVLVAESSSERIAGSIVLQRVFRLNAPLPVPELYDPPLNIRFLMEK